MGGVEGGGRTEARFSTLLLNLALKRRSSTAVISKIKIVGQECPTHTDTFCVLTLRKPRGVDTLFCGHLI
jgi:hypothetical protein